MWPKSHIHCKSVSHPYFCIMLTFPHWLTRTHAHRLIHTKRREADVLFLRRAVQPGPGWWSAVASPGTDCKAQCRCDRLPPPRGAPRPWGSARTGRGRERSRSPRPLYRGWWALETGSLTLSLCWEKKRWQAINAEIRLHQVIFPSVSTNSDNVHFSQHVSDTL